MFPAHLLHFTDGRTPAPPGMVETLYSGMFTTVFNWCRISQAHPQYGTPLDARADARAASGLFRVFAFLLAKRDQFLWESHGTRGGPVSLSLLVYKLIISI